MNSEPYWLSPRFSWPFASFVWVGLSAAAEKEFPDWDQGVYAEINEGTR